MYKEISIYSIIKMEKQDINEIYGENNIYNQEIIICIDKKYSKLIKIYTEDDFVFGHYAITQKYGTGALQIRNKQVQKKIMKCF